MSNAGATAMLGPTFGMVVSFFFLHPDPDPWGFMIQFDVQAHFSNGGWFNHLRIRIVNKPLNKDPTWLVQPSITRLEKMVGIW